MYSKCNCHITDLENAFDRIKNLLINLNVINRKYCFYIKNEINAIDINEFSTLGQQIKHYKQLRDIQQKDLAKELNIDRYTLHCIENKKSKIIFYPETINKVIDKLEIKDKLIWNDSYEEYIIKNNRNIFKEFRTKYNLTSKQFSKLLNEHISAIGTWERKNTIISRKKYYEILNKLNTITKEYIDNYFETDYTLFIKNNPHKQIVDYINKENISLKEFSKRINRH